MNLHACWQGNRQSDKPVLVWLHGLLGSAKDWQPVQSLLEDWPQLAVDLPGHGGSQAQQTRDFDRLSASLNQTLRSHHLRRYWLIGYSLGGRVALFHACRHAGPELQGVIVEGAHYGLKDSTQRQQRQARDADWAGKFRSQPLAQTLDEWYRQPVFADLTDRQRAEVIKDRRSNHPEAVAAMLQATSLSQQPCLLSELLRLKVPVSYFCGERDSQFLQLAGQSSLPCTSVPAAGHNAHRENPAAFAQLLAQRLTSEDL
ncbi:2-succinyl-6-hydroxy-2,4-cyclohexadiene-1-carboxylate synthase [Erwinia sp.]|uniref:2-succinyl-6-hydroxy-2, 4-cyclohexadiene-1-carboxylate synthase n=1 Tax=Erwinia citreus TaxID=558 RepID=UPI003C72DFE3